MMDKPVKRKFEIPKEFWDHLLSLQDKETVEMVKKLCKRVEELVEKLEISDQCIAFVMDGDLAISWRACWTEGCQLNKSKLVSYFQVTWDAVFDAVYRVHMSSCPGHSNLLPLEITCIHLWMTWSPASGFLSGLCLSTRIISKPSWRLKLE